jgi:peptidoglycan/LPS O-acetylase OafA/YrhL
MKLSEVSEGRDNNFNLIRIIAALSVLVSHSFRLSNLSSEPFETTTGLGLGTMAVNVFFVISGFLVSKSLLTRSSTLDYACARVLRIYPALLVMVALTVFCLGPLFTEATVASYFTAGMTRRFILQDSTLIAGVYYFLPGVFQHNPFKGSVNGSLWSMVHEIRLYVLLALMWTVLHWAPKIRPRLFEISIVLAAVVFGIWDVGIRFFLWQSHNFIPLAFMFFFGASFYVLRKWVWLSWVFFCFLAVALAVSAASKEFFFIAYNLTLPYLLFFLAYVPAGFVRSYNRLGDYSYGVYIYAFPVQQSLVAVFPGISCWNVILVATPIALMLAGLSWHFVEKRALGLKSLLLDRARSVGVIQSSVSLCGK